MNLIRAAILGGATHSAVGSAHISALRLSGRFDLVAGCFSKNKQKNLESAALYRVDSANVYDSLGEMLEAKSDDLDVVILLTPTDQHYAEVLQCIDADIPVICEKALAGSVAETIELNQRLKQRKGFLAVTFNYLGYPMIRELKKKIADGDLGNIHHIQVEMPQESFIRVDQNGQPLIPQTWRLRDGIVPTISLDLGVHLHILIKYLTCATPLRAIATSQSYGNFSEIKDNVSGMIEYDKELSCNMWFSKIAIGNRNGMAIRVFGDKAAAGWVQEDPEKLHMANQKGLRWILDRGHPDVKVSNQTRYTRFKAGHPSGFVEAFSNYYEDISQALLNYQQGREDYMGDDCFGIPEALEGLCLLEAMERSGSSKVWESITEKL